MKIAICDDTKLDLENLTAIIQEYAKLNNVQITIESYNDPEKLLNKVRYFSANEYDGFVLDVVMQKNGIDVAAKLRESEKDIPIIFATSSKEFALDAFRVRAFDYILKPLDRNQVYECLERLVEHVKKTPKNICSIKTLEHTLITIDIKTITYIESNDRRMFIHLNNKEIITSTSLRTKFLESVPFDYEHYNFICCHNSFLVNMNYIRAINDDSFLLKNNEKVPISKRMFTQVKDKYIKYLLGE